MLSVCEIFESIQGESTYAGCVCTFVRLSGCNLACAYCDTAYAREPGMPMEVGTVVGKAVAPGNRLIEITGGEPLLQDETPELCRRLLAAGHTVLVETNGSCDISVLPRGCVRIMDVKSPASGMAERMRKENLTHLTDRDEVKFVIANRTDFAWSSDFVRAHGLDRRCAVIFAPAFGVLHPRELAEWIIADRAPVRLGLQIHKYIWGSEARSV